MKVWGFYKKRKIFFGLSLVMIAIGIVLTSIFGVQLDIQFKGGIIAKYTYDGEVDLERIDRIAEDAYGRQVSIQQTRDINGKNQIIINVAGDKSFTAEVQQKLIDGLRKEYPDHHFEQWEVSNVDPYIGREFLLKSIGAVLIAMILIVIYVWFRFRNLGGLSAGVMALMALLHDIILCTFAFTIFRIPLNDNYIAVVLTIVGYSINDTIVIYDRIRENRKILGKKVSLDYLTDMSISQSIVRSLNTSIATFLSLLIVCIFAAYNGISSIWSFAFPMMIGVVSGCYSTIFIAGPLWVMWRQRTKRGKHSQEERKA